MNSADTRRAFILAGVIFLLYLGACTSQTEIESTPSPSAFAPVTGGPTQTQAPSATPTAQPTVTPTQEPLQERVQTLPDPGQYRWAPVVDGLTQPVGLTTAGDGSGRLFIIEQPGRIRVVEDGGLRSQPFLDIRDRVGDSGNEQGLLGLAFHPDYRNNGYFFVNYTDNNGDTVVSRFTVSGNRNEADAGTESPVLTFNQPYRNHNGGHLLFGPDEYLWISTGDGGSGGDPEDNAQNLGNLLGKLLRIQVDELPYTIPEGNPFGNEIWAFGLRNPWRFTFDPATKDLYIADVGQNQWEEVDYLPARATAGANFGWDYLEGSHPFEGTPPADAELVGPVAEYSHSQGCSVSGGAVYRGSIPAWQGVYLYGDYCSGLVWGLLKVGEDTWQNELLFDTNSRISAISQDERGEVYLLDIRGTVYRLTEE